MQRGAVKRTKTYSRPVAELPERTGLPRRRKLTALPRWETPEPKGVAGSYGGAIAAWAWRNLGLDLDPWQRYALDKVMRHDKAGDLITRVAVVSVPRQNGKTVIIRALIGWMLTEGRDLAPFAGWTQILSAAHDARQARIPYSQVLADLAGTPMGRAFSLTRLAGIRTPDDALTYDVATNQPGSQRGSSNGLITLDEALTQRDWSQWEALAPTQSAQRSPLMLMTSTAGHPDSVLLRTFYDRIVRIATGDELPDPTFYGSWWAAPEPTQALDWDAVAAANPSLGKRLTRRAVESEYRLLPPDSWIRERLNLWPEQPVAGAFAAGLWARGRIDGAPAYGSDGPYHLGVQVAMGWQRAAVCVAVVRPDGRIGTEVVADIRGSAEQPIDAAQVTDAIDAFARANPVATIAYDAASAIAPAALRHATRTGLPYDALPPGACVKACMTLSEKLAAGQLVHNDRLLDHQLPLAAKRPVGSDGAWRWGIRSSAGDIDAVVAMTFAVHAAAYVPMPTQIFV